MTRSFARVLLGMWAAMALSVALALFIATWLPGDPVADGGSAAVAAAAREVGEMLAADADANLGAVLGRRPLDSGGELRLFLVDASGVDVLGRDLPLAISRWLRRGSAALMDDLDWASRDARLAVHPETVAGRYRLVGYRSGLRPLVGVLERRGGRLSLLLSALAVSMASSFVLARHFDRRIRAARAMNGGQAGRPPAKPDV